MDTFGLSEQLVPDRLGRNCLRDSGFRAKPRFNSGGSGSTSKGNLRHLQGTPPVWLPGVRTPWVTDSVSSGPEVMVISVHHPLVSVLWWLDFVVCVCLHLPYLPYM